MKFSRRFAVALLCVLCISNLARADTPTTKPVYSTTRPSDDGIGKVYMGREIAFVMGHQGIHCWSARRASWKNNPAKPLS